MRRRLSPADLLGHLVNQLDDDPSPGAAIARASYVVVRHMMGQLTEAEALLALDEARALMLRARNREVHR